MATYTSAATGLWSAGATWVGGVKPPSGAGHKIVIASGHVVEYDEAAGEYGDDTSSATAANNAIVVNGTLKASRSVSTSLTCRGTLFYVGTLDWGSTADPIPSGVTAEIKLNYSASLAAAKHGVTCFNATSPALKVRGAVRTRNTTLVSGISAGATSIQVAAANNWAIGDILALESDTDDPSRSVTVTVSSVSGTTIGISASTYALPAGARVGNLSSNVTLKSYSATTPGFVSFSPNTASATPVIDFGDVALLDVGAGSLWTGIDSTVRNQGAIALSPNAVPSGNFSMSRIAIRATTTAVSRGVTAYGSMLEQLSISDTAIYLLSTGGFCVFYAAGSNVDVEATIYRGGIAASSQFSDGSAGGIFRGFAQVTNLTDFTPSIGLQILATSKSVDGVVKLGNGAVTVEGGTHNAAYVGYARAAAVSGQVVFKRSSFSAAALAGAIQQTANLPAQSMLVRLISVNANDDDNRVMNYHHTTVTDPTTRKRSTYSVKLNPRVANTAITYTFTIPAVSGVQQTIKGALRFDSTYGTATPPSIALSGQGVTQSHTCAAVADAWDDFTFTFTPTSTGDITATVTVQSTSTSGFAWLDGIYHYPMTQSVRHYGYQFLAQTALIADDKLTVTNEATVLAYPVTVDHGTNTITVTGDATATEVADYLVADLCQTANQGEAVHYTLGVGGAFTTSYEVLIGSGVAITGAYTDALGLHVAAEATLPTTGCQIQLYDVTADAELDNREVAGTAYSYPITYDTYTAGHTLRLRVAQAGASTAKLPQEVVAALTTGGAVFTVPDEDDTVYAANGVDGSTCDVSGGGEFTADYPNLQIDVSDVDSVTSVQRVYAWSAWANTTTQGIRLMFGAVEALDALNYVIHQDVVDAKFDNVNGTPVLIAGGYIRRADGSTVIAATSGSIQMDPGRAYVAPSIESDVAAIKAKTDNLPADPADASDIAASFSAAAVTAAAIKAKTDNLPAAPAAVGDIPTSAQNADKLLGRNLAGAADGGRTVKDALRASRNKSQLVGGTLTVYQEDDATPAWTADVTTASRDPVSGIDPA